MAKHFCLECSLAIDWRPCPVCGEPLKIFRYPDGRVRITNIKGQSPNLKCCREDVECLR